MTCTRRRCPPGHGDIYPSLLGSGMLQRLVAAGIEYLFVSNSDNLGATLDVDLLAYFVDSGKAFLMEARADISSPMHESRHILPDHTVPCLPYMGIATCLALLGSVALRSQCSWCVIHVASSRTVCAVHLSQGGSNRMNCTFLGGRSHGGDKKGGHLAQRKAAGRPVLKTFIHFVSWLVI